MNRCADAAPTTPSPRRSVAADGQPLLPAIYCRHCGRSGWAALSPERDSQQLNTESERIYRASVGRDKRRVRALIPATAAEQNGVGCRCTARAVDGPPAPVRSLRARRTSLGEARRQVRQRDPRPRRNGTTRPRQPTRCPACGGDQGIRFLGPGHRPARLGGDHPTVHRRRTAKDERKTLLFNDSVQDAAQRAGFVAARSYSFSLRVAARRPAHARCADAAARADRAASSRRPPTTRRHCAAVVPPDLHERPGVDALLAGDSVGNDATWSLVAQRLAFATVLECGLRSRPGRTLEATRTAVVEVALDDAAGAATLCGDVLDQVRGRTRPHVPSDARFVALPARPAGTDAHPGRGQPRVAEPAISPAGAGGGRSGAAGPTACPPSRAA